MVIYIKMWNEGVDWVVARMTTKDGLKCQPGNEIVDC